MKKIFLVFLFVFFATEKTFAATNYFEIILNGIKENSIFSPLKNAFNLKGFGQNKEKNNFVEITLTEEFNSQKRDIEENDYIDTEPEYNENVGATSTDNVAEQNDESEKNNLNEENQNISENSTTTENRVDEKPKTLIEKILERLTTIRSTPVQSLPANNSNQNQNYDNPYLSGGQANPQSVLGQLLNSSQGKSGAGQANSLGNMANVGKNFGADGLGKYSPGPTPDMLATPYTGPGGSLPGECGIPKGPMAYNIGGKSVSCSAKTIFEGKDSSLRGGVFGGGYINPLIENTGKCKYTGAKLKSAQSASYGEDRAADYGSQEAMAYIDCQILHWKAEAARVGQKCIPVDIDNCDSIGAASYKKILDRVEELNQGGAIVKVMTKNPHLASCNFFSHPAVVGAFIEEISPADAKKVSEMRNKAEQILLFARGGTGSNQKLKQIENLKIPNSTYSYDTGSEYQNIIDCTYNQ